MSKTTKFKFPTGHNILARDDGNVAVIFGLAALPAMLTLGSTMDFTRYAVLRSKLQAVTDSAVLRVASKMTTSTTADQAKAQAQVVLNTEPSLESAQIVSVSISDNGQTLCATSQAQMRTAFMAVAHIATLSPSATACANLAGGVDPNTTFEIALVVDNSGSMLNSASGQTKLQALKTAATSFVGTMFGKAAGRVQFSIVPFAGAVVAVDPTIATNRALPWIDTQGDNSQHWVVFGGKSAAGEAGFTSRFDIYDKLKQRNSQLDWRGCFEAPTYPNNVRDTAVSGTDAETLFVPYLAPDEPSGYSNNDYLDDNGAVTTGRGRDRTTTYACSDTASGDWNKLTHVCKYKPTASRSGNFGPTSYFGPNAFCPDSATQTVLQLTSSLPAINLKINQLAANGNTNLHEGLMWGWRTISPNGPYAQGRAYTTQNNRKIIVFMTDGYNHWGSQTNTVVGSDYEALGYYSYNGANNLRLPNGSGGDHVNYQTALAAAANKSTSYRPTSRLAQDDLTSEACTNAKTAGVEVFTIGFSTPTDPIDQQGIDLLKTCATNTDHYFAAANSDQLNAAFSQIGIGLGKLRLSQ